MPTPVSAARQCLTDEAARALDDAVAVARRRSHAQTTSLHAVSALLALPSSSLRDAITRSRTAVTAVSAAVTVSPRLQLRALELSVGVSLDRLPSSKPSSTSSSSGDDDGPPVSNSLMAAIKRSQANQRRHPDTFHLMQIHNHQNPQFNQGTASFLKVELKHFVLSILDDPIVSRVFGEAGFRSPDIKLALLQPPHPPPSSRIFSRTRCPPPLFLCNLDPARPGPGFTSGFPFVDENCRRVAEILTRKNKRNPLLMGVYAKTAHRSFVEMIEKGRGVAVFPPEMTSVNVISVENEIQQFLTAGAMSEEKMGLRFDELGREAGQCSNDGGGGVVVSFGDVEAFVKDGVDGGAVGFVVSRITRLLLEGGGGGGGGGKVWLVGVSEKCDAYSKFLGLFPNLEQDWDLYPMTVTSATPSMEGLYPKSSLMGSFIPFGGFFSTPSEIKTPVSCSSASFARCDKCNEKYEDEVADLKVNEESRSLNDRILGCQKKWNDICHNLHHTRSVVDFGISQTRPQTPSLEGLRFGSEFGESGSKDPSHREVQYSNQISYLPREAPSIYPLKHSPCVPVSPDAASISTGTDHVLKFSGIQPTDVRTAWIAPSSMANTSILDHRSSSSLTPVTTDLGLGMIYTSAAQEPDTPKLQDPKKLLPNFSESLSFEIDAPNDNASHQTPKSSCSFPNSEGNFDSVDFKSLNQLLAEKVGWQDDAIYAINRSLFLCNSSAEKRKGSRADIWFAFLGPDRIGKKKIASALAEIIFGNKENLISIDLSLQDRSVSSNSVFDCQISHCNDALRRKTVVDYVAGELSKKPLSVVFLDHVDKADYLVQTSLSQALRTGKFPDSHGREISINNRIFIVASTVCKGNSSSISEGSKLFSEERILEAKKCQMQLILGHSPSEDAIKRGITNVKVICGKGFSEPPFLSKRKQADTNDSKEEGNTCKMQKLVREEPRSYLDLNMPLDEGEGCINDNDNQMENSRACSSDICNQIEEKVLFKPFNFDALADQLLKSISTQFQRTFGSDFQLEIEFDVMIQILAAAWLSEKKNAVEDWIERVLGRAFVEAKQKKQSASSSSQYVMKLVNCESNFVEEIAHGGVCLPSRINLN